MKKIIDAWYKYKEDKTAKRNSQEPKRNPYTISDYCILKDKIEHQGIGGKKAYFDKVVTVDEIAYKAIFERNAACENFVKRRPDLFKFEEPTDVINPKHLIKPSNIIKPEARNKKFHYVKIWNTNEMTYPEYCYLGYVICSDEIKKAYKVNR